MIFKVIRILRREFDDVEADTAKDAAEFIKQQFPASFGYSDSTVVTPSPVIDKPAIPGIVTVIGNAARSAASAIANPTKASPEEQSRRLEICHSCEFLVKTNKGERCGKCGCFIKWKAALETWHCPINKW